MTTTSTIATQIEPYLLRLRTALGRMPDQEKAEIVSDIRNHIDERVAEAVGRPASDVVAETIAALGTPETLAASYQRERLLASAAVTPAPRLLLRATFQWALTAVGGFLAFLALLIGYSLGLAFLVCAALKPFFPDKVGLWIDPPMFSLGFIMGEHPGKELLRWWIIPIGYSVGPMFLIGTTRFIQWLLRQRSAPSWK